MVLALKQGDTSDPTNPALSFVYIESRVGTEDDDAGFLADVESLTYRVLRPDGTEHTATTAVDLTDAPTGARTSVGTYTPTISIVGGAILGVYSIEWVAKRVAAEDYTVRRTTSFRVVASTETIPNGYALISDMRRQGVPNAFCDADIVSCVEEASRFIDDTTRRFFSPRFLTLHIDGSGRGILQQYDNPIIGLSDISTNSTGYRPSVQTLTRENVRVYNRHMRGLTSPDDRDDPRVEFVQVDNNGLYSDGYPWASNSFADSQQNVEVSGWFGYTDNDGSPFGVTPLAIRKVTMMLAMKELRPLWEDFSERGGAVTGPVQEDRTRDQTIKYATGDNSVGVAGGGWITGDSRIDNILAQYIGPIQIGAV